MAENTVMFSEKQLVDRFNYTQTLPHVAIKVNQLVNSESSTMKEFEEIIQLDPVLVYRLLQMVNSSYFSLAKPVTSIPRAVAYLGMKTLRNLVAVDALKKLFAEEDSDQCFSRKKLWFHSATVAILANMISERIFKQDGEDAFLAAIMHDIGMIVEDQVAGDLLRECCEMYKNDTSNKSLTACEIETIGTDHGKVGAFLIEGWDMSWDMYNAIKLHHSNINDQALSSMPCIVQLADYFANRLNYSNVPGRYPALPTPLLAAHVREMMPAYREIAEDLPGELENARELYEL